MANNPLHIINVSPIEKDSVEQVESTRTNRIKAMQAKFERIWLTDPERFNPLKNCMERERLERTWQLLIQYTNLPNKQVADIGCGMGVFAFRLRDAGAQVDAIDISVNALKLLKKKDYHSIQPHQDTMPVTSLPDHKYDIIICTELIAELPREDYRLFFAELSRLLKSEGFLICSSAIDIDTEGGVQRLVDLAQTEFNLLDATSSYHALYLRFKRFLEVPSLFIKGWKDPEFKKQTLSSRQGLNWLWFQINTIFLLIWTWYALQPLAHFFLKILRNNRTLLLGLEKICHFIWEEDGVSHYLFIAKRRPLKAVNPEDIPLEKPRRKELWE